MTLLPLVRRQLTDAARRLSRGLAKRLGARLARGRALPALFALLALACVGMAGCGGIPGDAVARVNGGSITTATFSHWMRIAAASSSAGSPGKAVLPEPPHYTACVANLRAGAQKPAKGERPPSTATLRSQCAQQYTALKTEALGYLISADWLIDEAAAQKVAVSDQEVHSRFVKLRTTAFTSPAAFEGFLRRSDYTVSDVLLRVKLEMLGERLEKKVMQAPTTVTHASIESYYRANRARFGRQSLAQASAAIKQQLAATQREQRFAAFKAAFEKHWRAKTTCRAGYVVAECSEYHAPAAGGAGAGR
jgi:foldase protein PrsA